MHARTRDEVSASKKETHVLHATQYSLAERSVELGCRRIEKQLFVSRGVIPSGYVYDFVSGKRM